MGRQAANRLAEELVMRTLIVDDHRMFAEGLALLLGNAMPSAEIRCSTSGSDALQLLETWPVDLILLDWRLNGSPTGADLMAQLQANASARIVVVSGENDAQLIRDVIELGAAGFVLKESSSAILVAALKVVAEGGIYLPLAVLGGPHSAPAAVAQPSLKSLQDALPGLTFRERDVLACFGRGQSSNKKIARELEISENTVKQHLTSVFRKLGVSSRTDVVIALARSGARIV